MKKRNNLSTISKDFREALKFARKDDVIFSKTPISSHYESNVTKIGYKPESIRGVSIPSGIMATYVNAVSDSENYWYVVTWPDIEHGKSQTYRVTSEDDAQNSVLEELRKSIELVVDEE